MLESSVQGEGTGPIIFDEFIDSGLAEKNSPFLTPPARKWAENLHLKASLVAAVLLLVSFALSYTPQLLPLSHLLLLTVYILAGVPALIDSVEDLLDLQINIDVLMTLAAFSSVLIGSGMEGALLLVLFAISGSMEQAVSQKAKGALSHLRRLSPSSTWVIQPDGSLLSKAVRDITPGTHILIKAGEVVPLDGRVTEGCSSINLVHLTGESLPVSVAVGDEIASGATNIDGALTLLVTQPSRDSTLAKIVRLITQAQEAKPKLQQWFDRFSRRYATSIIALSGTIAALFPFLLDIPFLGTEGSLYRALAFLIAASPCALILAIPITYLSAVSVCAKQGILVKGGVTLDSLASCSTLAFDKTGTLTTGELTCEGVEEITGKEVPSWAIGVAAALERNAVHPIAQAVLSYAEQKQVPLASLQKFRAVPGEGLKALLEREGQTLPVRIGRPEFLLQELPSALAQKLQEKSEAVRQAGALLAALSIGEQLFLFRFRDTPREGIGETLQALKQHHKMGLVMLTGDHLASAANVAKELSIDEFYADLKPEDKLDHIATLSREGGLAMIGDGINDAPALARATTGIAMGKVGSATATDAADIILLQDDIQRLDWLVGKARATRRIMKQNLTLALAAILIASGAALSGTIPLWLAVILHEGGTVLVGLNGLRLLRK